MARTVTRSDGSYEISDLPPGESQIIIRREGFPSLFHQAQRTVEIELGETTNLDANLWGGDMDGQDGITEQEWYMLASARIINAPAFDINGDGNINLVDVYILESNLGRTDLAATDATLSQLWGSQRRQRAAPRAAMAQDVVGLADTEAIQLNLTGSLNEPTVASGIRLTQSEGATIATITPAGEFADGYLSWEQHGTEVYIVAALTEQKQLPSNAPLITIELAEGTPDDLSIAASTVVGNAEPQTNRMFLPLLMK